MADEKAETPQRYDPEGFCAKLFAHWRDHDWLDIDSVDMETLMKEFGLLYDAPATAEDCEQEWAQEYDIGVGDMINKATPTFAVVLKGRGQLG